MEYEHRRLIFEILIYSFGVAIPCNVARLE
jgi:hypothetical protein